MMLFIPKSQYESLAHSAQAGFQLANILSVKRFSTKGAYFIQLLPEAT
jgi:hypothetical protein